MAEHVASALTEDEVAGLARKLTAWLRTLEPKERAFLVGVFDRAAGNEPADTQGYDASWMDAQISAMMNNNLQFLALQTKVQNVSQTGQLLANIAGTDNDAKLNAVRNVRA